MRVEMFMSRDEELLGQGVEVGLGCCLRVEKVGRLGDIISHRENTLWILLRGDPPACVETMTMRLNPGT